MRCHAQYPAQDRWKRYGVLMIVLLSPSVSHSQANLSKVVNVMDQDGTGRDDVRIAQALNAASDGDVISVEPGTYVWHANVAWPADKAITLSCAPGAVFTRDASYTSTFFSFTGGSGRPGPRDSRITGCQFLGSTTVRQSGMYFFGGDTDANSPRNIRIDQITVKSYAGNFIDIRSFDAGVPNHISIDHNQFLDFWENVVSITSGRQITASDNWIQIRGLVAGAGGSAPLHVSIRDGCPCTPVATDVFFENNTVIGPDDGSNFVAVGINNGDQGSLAHFRNFVIRNNFVRGVTEGIRIAYTGEGRGVWDSLGVVISNNTLLDVRTIGIELWGGAGHVVQSNTISASINHQPSLYDAISQRDTESSKNLVTYNTSFNPVLSGSGADAYGVKALLVSGGDRDHHVSVEVGVGPSPPATLDVAGTVKAEKFVGDGSGLTGLSVTDLMPLTLDPLTQRVGIGTANPLQKLHLRGGQLALDVSQNLVWYDAGLTEANVFVGRSGQNLAMGTRNVTRLLIDDGGRVGIGTLTPRVKLDVAGAIAVDNNQGYFGRTASGAERALIKLTSGDYVTIGDAITDERLMTLKQGRVGVGTSNPKAKVHVAGGDVYASAPGTGIILKSPNGARCKRLGINNRGALIAQNIACP